MNTNELDKIYIGANEVTKLYNGVTLAWEKGTPSEQKIIAFNFSDGNNPVGNNWNNITYNVPSTYTDLKYIDGSESQITISDVINWGGASTETYAGTLPEENIYKSDWWGQALDSVSLVFNNLDSSKKYKIKIIGSIEPISLTKFNIVNDSNTAITPVAYPNSSDLLNDTNYVVFDNITEVTSITLYGYRVSDYQSLLGAILIEGSGSTPPIEDGMKTLTINVSGIEEDVDIIYNDEIQPNNTMLFPVGTEVNDITPSSSGYIFSPVSQNVVMDSDKTIAFTATEE